MTPRSIALLMFCALAWLTPCAQGRMVSAGDNAALWSHDQNSTAQEQRENENAVPPQNGTQQVFRWLSEDPIGEEGGLNLYGYVGNGPTRAWDPWGWERELLPDYFVGPPRPPGTFGTWDPGQVNAAMNPTPTELEKGNPGLQFTLGPFDPAAFTKLGNLLGYVPSSCPTKASKYPRNPDNWTPPKGWKETNAGQKTGGKHRQWVDENGRIRRRWDQEGREAGKDREEHWHDYDDPSGGKNHIDPDD